MSGNMMGKVKEIISRVTGTTEIMSTDILKDKGVTSLNLMAIMSNIENEFDVEIPEEELVLSNFETLATICNMLNRVIESN